MSTTLLEKKKVALLAFVLATSLTFAACTPTQKSTDAIVPTKPVETAMTESDSDNDDSVLGESTTLKSASMSGETGILDPATNVRTVTIEAGSFYYSPNVIKVKKGEKIKLVMNSKDMMHDLNIDELKVSIPKTKGGESASVEFTADKVGTFEYYCSVGEHRANGQVGTLIVE